MCFCKSQQPLQLFLAKKSSKKPTCKSADGWSSRLLAPRDPRVQILSFLEPVLAPVRDGQIAHALQCERMILTEYSFPCPYDQHPPTAQPLSSGPGSST
jgi:hypothetical protein